MESTAIDAIKLTRETDNLALINAQLQHNNLQLQHTITQLEHQLNWFKRQLFGQKSEKRDMTDNPYQQTIVDILGAIPTVAPKPQEKTTITYQRGKARKALLDGSPEDSGLRFDENVPVEEINLPTPELEGANADDYEIIGNKTTYRLAQRPGSHVVLKYIRQVVKQKSTGVIITPPAPANVLDKSFADVSFMAGLLIDKFCYHLPLYRQHQRLEQQGIQIARSTLTHIGKRSIDLLKPIVQAQLNNQLSGRILAMDETPIKAGRGQKGKLKQAYFWPVYGEQDEVCFPFSTSRGMQHIKNQLATFSGTLITDGYGAYARYQKNTPSLTHAQCWAHSRRYFEKANEAEPESVAIALAYIGRLYVFEKEIHEQALVGEKKLQYRVAHSKPVVDAFFKWCHEQRQRIDLVNTHPLSRALGYIMKRTQSLSVFLGDPDVPMDTNHLERALRVIPMGRKNWLFCWTELGAEQVGIIQSLLVTCKLQGVNFYDYLVDVLQRVGTHPASRVIELTPRLWKEQFASNPLRSDLYAQVNNGSK